MKLLLRTLFLLLFVMAAVLKAEAGDGRNFKVFNAANGLADNSALAVLCTDNGRMIIATQGNLNFYDGASFSYIDALPEYQYQLPLYKGNFQILDDKKGHLWLKSDHSLACVDLLNEQYVANLDSVFQQVLHCCEMIEDLFVDKTGSVWLLTDKCLYNSVNQKYYNVLKDCNLQDMQIYRGDTLLLFYDNGEEIGLEVSTGKMLHRTRAYDRNEAKDYGSNILTFAYKEGFFQIRNGDTSSVLMYFDPNELKWSTIEKFPYHLNGFALEEGSSHLYIPSEQGYLVYDMAGKTFIYNEGQQASHAGNSMEVIYNAMTFDKQGGLWIAAENRGVLYARPQSARFKVYHLMDPAASQYLAMTDHLRQNITEFDGKEANCMYNDSRDWMWIGTTKGLYLYRSANGKPVYFGKREGLINSYIHAIVEDKDHNIWLATSYGISCIIFKGDEPFFVNSFNYEDNVPNESFVNCKAVCLDDGTIIMQSIDHIVTFDPSDFTTVNVSRPLSLHPEFVRLLVNGFIVKPGEVVDNNVVLDKAITQVHDIRLNFNQNSISLTFSGMNYFRPIQSYYRVRVSGKGIQNDWIIYSYYNSDGLVDSRGKLHLPLINLQPGDYKVELEASMFPNAWSGETKEWVIHVNQPWWKTTGVYAILLFLLLLVLLANLFLYSRNTKMRARRNNEEGDFIKKLRSFVQRCDSFSNELLAPTQDEYYGDFEEERSKMKPEFIQLILKLTPYIHQQKNSDLTMSRLSRVSGIEVEKLYDIIIADLYKNPRELSKQVRLQRAKKMLEETELSIEEIADGCGFYTPNYFIGNFFHQYKLTPKEYREEKRIQFITNDKRRGH
jgi:AraC-like DNA-binding protein